MGCGRRGRQHDHETADGRGTAGETGSWQRQCSHDQNEEKYQQPDRPCYDGPPAGRVDKGAAGGAARKPKKAAARREARKKPRKRTHRVEEIKSGLEETDNGEG